MRSPSDEPDLAILDIKMPLVDGIEAAERITQARPIPTSSYRIQRDPTGRAWTARRPTSPLPHEAGSEEDLLPRSTLALTRFKEFRALTGKWCDLREALEARKVMEKAKGILMRRLDLTEGKRRSTACKTEPGTQSQAGGGGGGDRDGGPDAVTQDTFALNYIPLHDLHHSSCSNIVQKYTV